MKKKIRNSQAGITFVELVVVIGILTILFSFTTINLLRAKQSASLSSTIDLLLTDIRSQQLKAMTVDTNGQTLQDSYGVRFENDRYILFQGTTYNAASSSNIPVLYGDLIQTSSVTFPNNSIVFSKGNGEILNYASTSASVTIGDTQNGQQKQIQLNKFGVITSVN